MNSILASHTQSAKRRTIFFNTYLLQYVSIYNINISDFQHVYSSLLTHHTASSRLLIGCSAETCLNIQSNKDQRWKMSTIKTTIILPSNLNFFIHKMIEIPVSRSLIVSAGCVCMSVAPAQCSQVSCERWLYNWLGTDLYRNAPAPGHISTTLYSSLLLPPAPLLLPPALSRQRHSPVQTPHWASGLNEICPDFSFTFHGLMAGM